MILRRKRKSHSYPELPFFGFDIYRVLERAGARVPSCYNQHVSLWIMNQPTLACIELGGKPCIFLHTILNHHQTPELIMDFILTHELLHLIVPPRRINGIIKRHPPEFRDAERQAFPEADLAWGWVVFSLHPCLKPDAKREVTIVKKSWRRLVQPERLSIEQTAALLDRSKGLSGT